MPHKFLIQYKVKIYKKTLLRKGDRLLIGYFKSYTDLRDFRWTLYACPKKKDQRRMSRLYQNTVNPL
jgi:hypothetical protein